jgi:hypothetical protein
VKEPAASPNGKNIALPADVPAAVPGVMSALDKQQVRRREPAYCDLQSRLHHHAIPAKEGIRKNRWIPGPLRLPGMTS